MRRTALVILVLVLVGTLAGGCSRGSDAEAEPEYRLVPVERGDITVEVTSSGSLAYSTNEQLSFGVVGVVDEVYIEEGDTVAEGQLIASLDGASITALEKIISQARITLRNAEDSLDAVRSPHTGSDIIKAELAITSAELALEAVVDNLEQVENPYTESDILEAELAVMSAEAALDAAETAFELADDRYQGNTSYQPWKTDLERKTKLFELAGYDLIAVEDSLVEILAGADPLLVVQKQEQVATAEASLADAEEALAEMLAGPDPLLVELRQVELLIAQAALDDAIADLELYAIVAPFAGIITTVNVEPGQAVGANAVAVVLTDPTSFEALMLVNEIDILDVAVGAAALIEIDAIPGVSFPAIVTDVATSAVGQSGVVNYRVTAGIESLARPILSEFPEAGDGTPLDEAEIDRILAEAVADGRLPEDAAGLVKERLGQFAGAALTAEQLEQFIERFGQIGQGGFGSQFGQSGQDLTDEQREQFRQRGAQGGFFGGQGSQSDDGAAGGFAQRLPRPGGGRSLENLQLREGLSVTVSIIIQQRTSVLLVPNQAITLDGGQSYVNVSQGDVITPRLVVTGLSDWQSTEIVEGLSDGEFVAIPVSGSPDSSSGQNQTPQNQFRFPGGGGGFGR